jgi:phosphorylcholine metabolism protein LicD
VSKLFTQHGITHWIDYGTLLGAVRHKGHLIPWEYDADITVFDQHFHLIHALEAQIQKDGHWFYLQQKGYGRVFTSIHNGIYVDVYSAGRVPDQDPSQFYLISGGNIDPFHENFLHPMKTIVLEGMVFPAPNHPGAFLKTRYGNWDKTAPKKKLFDGPVNKIDSSRYGPDPIDFVE